MLRNVAELAIDLNSKTVILGEWRAKALLVRKTASSTDALIALSNGIHVHIRLAEPPDSDVWLSLCKGQIDTSNGIALIGNDDAPAAWREIPLCECGERGCGNAGRQFQEVVDGGEVYDLFTLLESLPYQGSVGR